MILNSWKPTLRSARQLPPNLWNKGFGLKLLERYPDWQTSWRGQNSLNVVITTANTRILVPRGNKQASILNRCWCFWRLCKHIRLILKTFCLLATQMMLDQLKYHTIFCCLWDALLYSTCSLPVYTLTTASFIHPLLWVAFWLCIAWTIVKKEKITALRKSV